MPPTTTDQLLYRNIANRSPASDRWPAPLAAAVIVTLSLVSWAALVQAARIAASLF